MSLFSIKQYPYTPGIGLRDTSAEASLLTSAVEKEALKNIAEAIFVTGEYKQTQRRYESISSPHVGTVTARPMFPTRSVTQEYANRIGAGIEALAYDVKTQFVSVDPSSISDSPEVIQQKINFIKSNPTGALPQFAIDQEVAALQAQLDSIKIAKSKSTADIQAQASFSAGFNKWYEGWKSLKDTVDDLPFIFNADIWDTIQAYEVDLPKWRQAFTGAKGNLVTSEISTVQEQKAANKGIVENFTGDIVSVAIKIGTIAVGGFIIVKIIEKI
jgi:hypothetical protein